MSYYSTSLNAPRIAFLGAAFLLASTLAFAGIARQTDVGATRSKAPDALRVIDLKFADRSDGAVLVSRAAEPEGTKVIAPGRDGFVRVALRSLAYDRRQAGVGNEVAFRLGQQPDKRLWLQDLATGRVLFLDAYGYENARSFAQFLEPWRTQQ